MNYEQMKKDSEPALLDPQAGDRWHEMFSFWLYVVARVGQWVFIMDGHTFPNERGQWLTVQQFQQKLGHGSTCGIWMLLRDRGNDVSGWLDSPTVGDVQGAGSSTEHCG